MNYISTEKFPDETNFQKLKVLLFLKIKSFTFFMQFLSILDFCWLH